MGKRPPQALSPLELGTPLSHSAVSKRNAKVAFRERNAERNEGVHDRLQYLLSKPIGSFSNAGILRSRHSRAGASY